MSKCINIVEEDNDKPYLYYKQSGYWNIEFISKKKNAIGFIVQEVKMINTTTIRDIDAEVHYYEAWPIKDGKCEDDETDIPDDTFGCGFEGIEHLLIKKSLGKTGTIEYYCKVYWVDIEDNHIEIVKRWPERGVSYAAKLKSILVSECPEFGDIKPVCERQPFIHKVNFENREIIKQSIIDLYKLRVQEGDADLQYDLIEILKDTPYIELAKEICVENNLLYD